MISELPLFTQNVPALFVQQRVDLFGINFLRYTPTFSPLTHCVPCIISIFSVLCFSFRTARSKFDVSGPQPDSSRQNSPSRSRGRRSNSLKRRSVVEDQADRPPYIRSFHRTAFVQQIHASGKEMNVHDVIVVLRAFGSRTDGWEPLIEHPQWHSQVVL